jgi:hypothetical protein
MDPFHIIVKEFDVFIYYNGIPYEIKLIIEHN